MSVEAVGRKAGPKQGETKPRKARSKPAKKKKSGRAYTITVTREGGPKRDARAEWQCERNGFYYTNDGRYSPLEEEYATELAEQLEETNIFQVELRGAPSANNRKCSYHKLRSSWYIFWNSAAVWR